MRLSFAATVRNAWVLLRTDAWVLIVSCLLVALVGGATLGLLSLPLEAGVYVMILRRVREGRKPQISDAFGLLTPFGRWLKAWLLIVAATVVLLVVVGGVGLAAGDSLRGHVGLALTLGGLALATWLVVSCFLSTMWLLTVPLMGDHGLRLLAALGASWRLVWARGFWRHFAVVAFRFGLNLAIVALVAGPTIVLTMLTAGRHAAFPPILPFSNVLVYGASALLGSFFACLVGTVYLVDRDETTWLPSSLPPGGWQPDQRWAAVQAAQWRQWIEQQGQWTEQQRQWAEQWRQYDAWLRQQGGGAAVRPPATPPPATPPPTPGEPG